jgi:microcystin-dependent protein
VQRRPPAHDDCPRAHHLLTSDQEGAVSEPFLGEIKIISWNFPPKGWAFCNGTLLPINQNQALFSILGTTYGGDGRQTFGLPNLQGRVPTHVGNGITLGEAGGETNHTLTIAELTAHYHQPNGSTTQASVNVPTGNYLATSPGNVYINPGGAINTSLRPDAISVVGGSQAHQNMSPYLVLNFIIALQGIFPSQN